MSGLYSKNREEPQEIHMLVFADGSTRTGDDYTKKELERAGYTGPYIRPEFDSQFDQLNWNSDKLAYEIVKYPDEYYINLIRVWRNNELFASDIYMIEDYPIEQLQKDQYKSYRTWLRDLPEKIEKKEYIIPKSLEEYKDFLNIKKSIILGQLLKNEVD